MMDLKIFWNKKQDKINYKYIFRIFHGMHLLCPILSAQKVHEEKYEQNTRKKNKNVEIKTTNLSNENLMQLVAHAIEPPWMVRET